MSVPTEIAKFLMVETPETWLRAAADNLDLLLLDHANCEMKAASTALALIYRYPEHRELTLCMSRLAREELRHFEQVQKHIDRRSIRRQKIGPAPYAGELLRLTSDKEPARLRQRLIVGALIEARSCERFARLIPWLDEPLAEFYGGLLASESRHFLHYLELAQAAAAPAEGCQAEIDYFRQAEADIIVRPDKVLRFHSGPPLTVDVEFGLEELEAV